MFSIREMFTGFLEELRRALRMCAAFYIKKQEEQDCLSEKSFKTPWQLPSPPKTVRPEDRLKVDSPESLLAKILVIILVL